MPVLKSSQGDAYFSDVSSGQVRGVRGIALRKHLWGGTRRLTELLSLCCRWLLAPLVVHHAQRAPQRFFSREKRNIPQEKMAQPSTARTAECTTTTTTTTTTVRPFLPLSQISHSGVGWRSCTHPAWPSETAGVSVFLSLAILRSRHYR